MGNFPCRSDLLRLCDAADVHVANLQSGLEGDGLKALLELHSLFGQLRDMAWGEDPFEAIGLPPQQTMAEDEYLDDLTDTFLHGQCFNFAPVLAKFLQEHLSPADAQGIELVSILGSRTDADEDVDPDEEVDVCIHCFVKVTIVNRETYPPADQIFYLDAEGVHEVEDATQTIVDDRIEAWQHQCIANEEDVIEEPAAHEYSLRTPLEYWHDLADSDAEQSDEWAAKALHLIQQRQDLYLGKLLELAH